MKHVHAAETPLRGTRLPENRAGELILRRRTILSLDNLEVHEIILGEAFLMTSLHAILLDIDHSPANLLHDRHAAFYRPQGLCRMARKIHPGGVFALWSDDAPAAEFIAALSEVFVDCESHIVSFFNPLHDRDSESTVYIARAR